MSRKSKARVEGATREPNGRLSRRQEEIAKRLATHLKDLGREERETMAPGVDARQRVFGLSISDAASPMAGSFVGRLYLTGEISRAQLEAAIQWTVDSENYARAVHAPRGLNAIDLNATKGRGGDYENVPRTVNWVERMVGDDGKGGARGAVQQAQNELRLHGTLFAALYECVQKDREHMHMVGDMKLGLNALVRHYGIGTRERKAA